MPVQVQIVIFAVIAAFVLFQLYNVLGKKVGRQPEDDARAQPPAPAAAGPDAAANRPNALDAVTGRPVRKVAVRIDVGDGRFTITVGDSGPGLEEEARSRVLERGWSTKADDDDGRGRRAEQRSMGRSGGHDCSLWEAGPDPRWRRARTAAPRGARRSSVFESKSGRSSRLRRGL